MSAERVLVTGATGFIGSHVARALRREGARVRVLARAAAVVAGFEVVSGSVNDAAAVAAAVEGVDTVYHFAAFSDVTGSVRNPVEAYESGNRGTFLLLEACRTAGVSRFVYCSTARAYGRPLYVPIDERHPLQAHEPYGGTKLAGEIWAQVYHHTYGLKTTALRPFSVYGPGRVTKPGSLSGVIPIFVERALRGEPLTIVGDGTQTKDFTYIDDVVRGFLLAARSDKAVGRALNLGAGQGVAVKDLARLVVRITGSASRVVHTSASDETVSNYASSALAEELLGWHAEVSLEEGLRRYVAWLTEARA
jgi:nucleoside-diphosphate-sugar epimerase